MISERLADGWLLDPAGRNFHGGDCFPNLKTDKRKPFRVSETEMSELLRKRLIRWEPHLKPMC